MKVVLLCGGFGMRMRANDNDPLPKPMQLVGPRPLLWHVMKYYAHFGHKDFILCLGYGAQKIKDFFLHYEETASNDFTLRNGTVELRGSDVADWTITFVNTGLSSGQSQRLLHVREYLAGEEMFLANYADVLTDAPLEERIAATRAADVGASLMVVPPPSSFHSVTTDEAGLVKSIEPISEQNLWVNGGYFVLTPEIFDYLDPAGDMISDGIQGMANQRRALALAHHGFWRPADTFKERAELDKDWESGARPWALWESSTPSRLDQ